LTLDGLSLIFLLKTCLLGLKMGEIGSLGLKQP
jgi:hypothetical protein